MPSLIALFLWSVILYLTWFFLDDSRKRKHLPPGPVPIPLLGSIHAVALAHSKPHLAQVKLSEKYGDLVRFRFGSHEYVLVCSARALKDLLSKEETMGRPNHGPWLDRMDNLNTGIVFAHGDPWRARRDWLVRNFKEMGLGRTSFFEEKIRSVINKSYGNLLTGLSESGKIIPIDDDTGLGVSSMMWGLLVGSQTPQDEADCQTYSKADKKWLDGATHTGSIAVLFPLLKKLCPTLIGHTAQMNLMQVGRRLAQKWYKKLMAIESDTPQSILHSYILEMKKQNPYFNEQDFNVTFTDVMSAALETTDNYSQALLLFLTCYPAKQQKLYDEITSKFPEDHELTIADLPLMPYAQAFMSETHRMNSLSTNWAPHTLTDDVTYRNFTMKKGTTLLPVAYAAFKSPTDFAPDPEAFRPERFIDPTDPSKLTDLRKLVTPFAVGKRVCPGEPMAHIFSFHTLVSTVKNFKLSCVPGEAPPSEEFQVSVSSKPRPFRVLITPRKSNV